MVNAPGQSYGEHAAESPDADTSRAPVATVAHGVLLAHEIVRSQFNLMNENVAQGKMAEKIVSADYTKRL
jgi:hypothetical protein